jgi:septal ring factor EnvC (AmiA/AmiB activator)
MDIKFPKVLGFLNLKSGTDAVTEANLQSAEDKIASLEQAKTTAEETLATVRGELATAQGELKTATDKLTTTEAALTTANDQVATLEQWKKAQQATDGRQEDESNHLDGEQPEAKASWEVAADSAIASAKKRVGQQ